MTPRDGLMAEYLFSGDTRDTSGYGHHGELHGATFTADRFGNAGQALLLDGVDDYVEVAPPPAFPSNGLTVSVWVRYAERDFRGWTNCIVAQDDGNDEDQSRRVFQLSTDHGHVVWHRMIGARDPMSRRRVRPGVWQHLVAVHDRGMNLLYVDGGLVDRVEHRLWTHASQPLHIGRKGTDEPFFFFKGAIDDLRIYGRALGREDIAALLHEDGWEPAVLPGSSSSGDPLSGRWGDHGVVFLDLRYDGKGGVTGQIMSGRPDNMAPIQTGTFDPASGDLHLDGIAPHPKDGSLHAYLIEGLLDEGQLAVRAKFGDYNGNHFFTREGGRLRLTRRSIRSQLGALAFRLRGA